MRLRRLTNKFITASLAAAGLLALPSCNDDLSPIGDSIVKGEVSIMVDSLTVSLPAQTVEKKDFDARTITKLLGRINVPEYGSLTCSFVSQILCAARMPVPDSITVNEVDSMHLLLSVPVGELTGDSLAPQQLQVYRLDRELPDTILSVFDPAGYYSEAGLMGSATYTLSNIAKGDSAMKKNPYVKIPVRMPVEFARQIFSMYRANDPVLQWPATFNRFFPGIYVRQSFGNGCIASVRKAEFITYWRKHVKEQELQPDSTYKDVYRAVADSMVLMASQPEVLSSNVIDYNLSPYLHGLALSGQSIVTTPGGYRTEIEFPARTLLDRYHTNESVLQVVSSLKFRIPASEIHNSHGIGTAPWLLMVKRSEVDSFFLENKLPDGVSSFYAALDATSGSYDFNNMRTYLVNLLEKEKKGEEITSDDTDFVLVPVNIVSETVADYSGPTTYVTRCAPYLEKPTMTRLHTDRAVIVFTYSSQQID